MFGYATTQKILHASYFWPSIFKDCILVVHKCHDCQIYQCKMHAPRAHLHPIITVGPFSMSHSFHTELSRIWQMSVDLYRRGNNRAEDFPIANELPILSGWGLNKMDVFDYVEDWCLHEEPDLITFVLVHYERWNFFVHEQKSELSSKRLDPSSLPPKTEDAAGQRVEEQPCQT